MDLKSLREASGLSQFAAANCAGLDRTRLSLVENGHIRLTANEESAVRRVLLAAIRDRSAWIEGVLASARAEVVHT